MKLKITDTNKVKTIINLFIVFSFLLIGCKSAKTTTELESTFNKQELKDLQTIRAFFIEDILELNDENFYQEFKDKIQELEAGEFATVSSKEIKKLLGSISKSTFNEIWGFKTEVRNENSLGTYKYLVPKEQGKYMAFLAKNTNHNYGVRDYYNSIIDSGNFSHLAMLDYVKGNTLEFDLQNPNIQIVLAVHYVSVCRDNNFTN